MLGDLGRVKWHLWTQPKSGPLIYFSFWLETGPLFTGLKIWTQMGQVRFGLSPYWDRFRSKVLSIRICPVKDGFGCGSMHGIY